MPRSRRRRTGALYEAPTCEELARLLQLQRIVEERPEQLARCSPGDCLLLYRAAFVARKRRRAGELVAGGSPESLYELAAATTGNADPGRKRLREELAAALRGGGALPAALRARGLAAELLVPRAVPGTLDFFRSHCDELLAALDAAGGLDDARRELTLFADGTHAAETVAARTAWLDGREESAAAEELRVACALVAELRETLEALGDMMGEVDRPLAHFVGERDFGPMARAASLRQFLDTAVLLLRRALQTSTQAALLRTQHAPLMTEVFRRLRAAAARHTAANPPWTTGSRPPPPPPPHPPTTAATASSPSACLRPSASARS